MVHGCLVRRCKNFSRDLIPVHLILLGYVLQPPTQSCHQTAKNNVQLFSTESELYYFFAIVLLAICPKNLRSNYCILIFN